MTMAGEQYIKPALTVAVFGDKKVGKTSLIRRFLGQCFSRHHHPTVEDYYEEEIIRETNRCRQLKIIDTTGSYDFPVMRQIAISKSEAFVLVYSLDAPESFDKLKWHREEILKYKSYSRVPMVIVCNKTDLTDISSLQKIIKNTDEVLPFSEQLKKQKQIIVEDWGCKLMFTSAKVRWNINKVFYELVALQEKGDNNGLELNNQRRRSSLWYHIVCSKSSQRPKGLLTRTRSLSA